MITPEEKQRLIAGLTKEAGRVNDSKDLYIPLYKVPSVINAMSEESEHDYHAITGDKQQCDCKACERARTQIAKRKIEEFKAQRKHDLHDREYRLFWFEDWLDKEIMP